LGIEDSHDRQHKNEKEKLKKEYMRRLRLVLGTELRAKNKIQAIRSLAVPVLRYPLEFLTGTRKKCKPGQENEETANHPPTASPKGRHRSLVCSQKTGRKGPDAIRRSLLSRNYETGGICMQKGSYTNTDCQNAPTQHQLSSVTDI
jgi:hypothetical protein